MRRDRPEPTDRIVFRTWRDDDLPLALGLFGDPRVTAQVGGPFDVAQVRTRLAAEIASQAANGYQYWPLFCDEAHVGCCGLRPRGDAVLELGFYIGADYWGRGFATEAARSVIAHAFDVIGVPALFAGHHPENRASQRTLEKLGFRYTHHEVYLPTGVLEPGYLLP